MERITIHAVRAVDEPWTCAEFAIQHAKVLKDFGIETVAEQGRWHRDNNIVVLWAEHAELGMVGGCRLHLARTPGDRLPVETSVGAMDPEVRRFIEDQLPSGVLEIGGLWNANRFGGRGIPHVLVMAGIAMASNLNANTVIGVAAKYTLRYALRLGLHVVERVGEKGWFDYPKPGFYGILTGTTNAISMDGARLDLRKRILSLRYKPMQRCIENTGTALLDIQYLLSLSNNVERSSVLWPTLRHSA